MTNLFHFYRVVYRVNGFYHESRINIQDAPITIKKQKLIRQALFCSTLLFYSLSFYVTLWFAENLYLVLEVSNVFLPHFWVIEAFTTAITELPLLSHFLFSNLNCCDCVVSQRLWSSAPPLFSFIFYPKSLKTLCLNFMLWLSTLMFWSLFFKLSSTANKAKRSAKVLLQFIVLESTWDCFLKWQLWIRFFRSDTSRYRGKELLCRVGVFLRNFMCVR